MRELHMTLAQFETLMKHTSHQVKIQSKSFTLNNPIDSCINFNVDSWIHWSLPKRTCRCLWGVLPHLETLLQAGGSVCRKVLNMEKIQLTFRSSLTVTLAEAVNLEVDIKKCASGFTVKTPTHPYFIPALMLCLLAVQMGCQYWPYSRF